jgi:hypothetical protein
MLDANGIPAPIAHISNPDKMGAGSFCTHDKGYRPAVMGLNRIQIEKIPGQQGTPYIAAEKDSFSNFQAINSHPQCF